IALAVLLVAVILALGDSALLYAAMLGFTVFLVIGPLTDLILTPRSGENDMVASQESDPVGLPAASPDVWFLVVDGYPSKVGLLEQFGVEDNELVDQLDILGFTVQAN